MEKISLTAKKSGKLSKIILLELTGVSFSQINKCLRNKYVLIKGARVNKDLLVNAGDKIDLYLTRPKLLPYEKVYEDENVILIDKKSGYESIAVLFIG